MMVLAPLLQREKGFAVVVFSATYLMLGLAILQVEEVRARLKSARSWNRLPAALSFLALVGWPLTLGAAARWLLLDVCRATGTSMMYYLVLLSYALVSVPVWRLYRELGVAESEGESANQIRAWTGVCAVSVPTIALLLVGFAPAGIDRVWAQALPLALPSWGGLLGSSSLFSVVMTASVLPIGGSYLIDRLSATETHLRDSAQRLWANLLRLDWLFLSLEEGLLAVQHLARETIAVLERSFLLGWTLIWCAAIVLYLLES
ncbi:MAG: hypothetical protein JXA74_10260 [Anaerolineae bacterium]|nr:hypothetical protein [Anaerolineae bacterium]